LDFLEGRVAVSPTEKKRLIGLLVNWAETTKDFVKIGDFDEEQLGFNGKEWVLLDVSGKGETVIEQKKSNSFDIGNNIFKIGSQYALPEESFRFSTEELKNIYQLLGSKIVKARIQSTSCREVHQYR
jgi:hypothetical protein